MATTDRTSQSVKEARELYELKQKAAKFYAENGVPQKMEEILNTMFYDNPKDVYGYLANYFQTFSATPTITQVRSCPSFDSKAQTTVQTEVYCTVNNKEKCVSRTVSSSQTPLLLEIARPEEREEEDKEREDNVTAAIKYINNEINQKLLGLDPTKQQEVDLAVSLHPEAARICPKVAPFGLKGVPTANIFKNERFLPTLLSFKDNTLIGELKAAEDERLAKEAEEREKTDGDPEEPEKKTGSALSKPKSGGKSQAVQEAGPGPTSSFVLLAKPKADRRMSITTHANSRSTSCANSRANSQASSNRGPTALRTIKQLINLSSSNIGDKKSKEKTKGKGSKGGGAPVVVIPDEPKESVLCGCCSVSAVSQAMCTAGASVNNSELYEYIAGLKYGASPREYKMPLPIVTIFQSGRSTPGKSTCIKEYMIVPKPGKPLKEAIPQIMAIYNDVVKSIVNKNGVPANKKPELVAAKNVSDVGALMMPFDRPEQGLDMIKEACERVGVTLGEDIFLALNLAGHEIFDYEKGKYEVITGQQKVADDLVEFWVELIGRYPAIIAIIDPMRKQEDRQWMSLCERISEKCYIMGDHVWHRPGLLKDETLPERFKSSGIVFRMEQMNTVTDIIESSQKMEEASNVTVLSTNIGETSDTFIADMAVGMNAMFLKVGAPCRGERVSKLNRLLVIEQELEGASKLAQHTDFTFPVITIPPEPEPVEDEAEVQDTPKDAKKK